MKGLHSSGLRATPVLRNRPQEAYSTINEYRRRNPSNTVHRTSKHNPLNNTEAPSRGNPYPLTSQLENTSLIRHPTREHSLNLKPIDHSYISRILLSKDWFLLLNHEFKAKRLVLAPQFVVSILQNQENPLNAIRFYIWVSNIDPSLAKKQSIRGVLGRNLYREGPDRPVLLSVDLLQQIKESGLKVTQELLCILLGSWGRLGLAKYCVEVFGQISFLGLNPTTRLYNAVIDALIKSNSLDLAYLKFQQMSSHNCVPDRFTYNILIHGVCRLGVVDEALRLMKQMEGLGYFPNVFTYTILIDGFFNAMRAEEAFGVLQTMKERNVVPNAATMRSLVHGVFRCCAPDKAFEYLLDFVEKKPGVSQLVCDNILYCLSNNSMASEAVMFLSKMGKKGYVPDSSTFNVTMACVLNKLDQKEACDIFDNCTQRGVKPGFSTYLALIEALYKAGKTEIGNKYMDRIIKDGLVSNNYSYNMVIDCLCKGKLMDRAAEIFRDLQSKGISPNIVTFNTLISGYCRNGVIDGLCQAHKYEDAFGCFNEMVEWDVTPNAITYNILIRSFCAIGNVARSTQLLRKMQLQGIQPDTFSFNALIQSYFRMNKVHKAEKLFDSMLRLGIQPNNYTYGAFIKSLCKSVLLTPIFKSLLDLYVNAGEIVEIEENM
ncbi:putative pentatricopeptide repeat-containing protein, mitochondrial, partial [Cucurbita argyrosperma subsp. sororia]